MVRIKITITAVILILMGTCLHAQEEVTARAGVDRQQYEVGDYINYSISVSSAKDVKITPPALKDSLKGAELIETARPLSEEKEGRLTTTFKYIISKYDSGEVRIPPLAVSYSSRGSQKTVLTNGVSFTVTTLKVKGEDIKDVKDPLKIPLDWKLILLWVLIALIVLAVAVYLYLYFRKKRLQRQGIIPVVKREPHEEALLALDSLEEKKLWQSGRIKEYHTEITEIIRTYFEKRFRVPALEITTNELMINLAKVKETENVRQITSDFLNNADLVKFAKYVPMESINEEMMHQARKIVKDTVPQQVKPLATGQEEASNVS